jgi:hypothetical protein
MKNLRESFRDYEALEGETNIRLKVTARLQDAKRGLYSSCSLPVQLIQLKPFEYLLFG